MEQPYRIGIAEDHELVRSGLRLLLEKLNFNVVVEGANGRELLDQLKKMDQIPDIVLVDVNMPVMNGPDTVRKLVSLYPALKIVGLSVNNDLKTIKSMIQAGANAYLFKDSSPETVRFILNQVGEKGFYYEKHVIESLMMAAEETATVVAGNLNAIQKVSLLTPREREFLKECCSERTYKEIADRMSVSLRTVDGYRETLFNKLDIRSRTGLVLFTVQTGIVDFAQL